jgi:hypothetical protein
MEDLLIGFFIFLVGYALAARILQNKLCLIVKDGRESRDLWEHRKK